MRATSSIAALHRGQEMLGFVLDSDIPLRRLKFATPDKNNGGKHVKVQEGCRYFLVVFRFREYCSSIIGN